MYIFTIDTPVSGLWLWVAGHEEAQGHPDQRRARPQQDCGGVNDHAGGDEQLAAVQDVEGGSYHQTCSATVVRLVKYTGEYFTTIRPPPLTKN